MYLRQSIRLVINLFLLSYSSFAKKESGKLFEIPFIPLLLIFLHWCIRACTNEWGSCTKLQVVHEETSRKWAFPLTANWIWKSLKIRFVNKCRIDKASLKKIKSLSVNCLICTILALSSCYTFNAQHVFAMLSENWVSFICLRREYFKYFAV